jgi:RNA exonuclease 1
VSVVDDCCKVVYDQLVKPSNPILDYVTEYSGITAQMLEGVTTTLAEVQEQILQLIDSSEATETYLVGHSLENDLYALKLFHPNVVDTAILYPHSKGSPFKFSLKNLAERYLGKQIQATVHDSIEDARTAMELARLKLYFGPSFGEFEIDGVSVCKILTDHQRYSSLLDRPAMVRKHTVGNANAILCNSDEEVRAKAIKEVKSETANLVWMQFADVYKQLEEEVSTKAMVGEIDDSVVKGLQPLASRLSEIQESFEASEQVQEKLRKMDERIGEIHESLPSNTMMIVLSGQGNTAYTRHLQQLKWKCKNANSPSLWDEKCDQHLNYSMRQAAETMCFMSIKE